MQTRKHLFPLLLAMSILLAFSACRPKAAHDNESEQPAFAWRGVMFDVSRHFFDAGYIKKQIDVLSGYGINTLHLHLTDAAGWRLEIKAYPRLTQYAAWRTAPDWKTWWNGDRGYMEEGADGAYGGYFTQEQMRDLVAYAAERGITIVPEIEMPGHSEEVDAAYPEYALHKGETVAHLDSLCTFYENVLTEVLDIFPSPFIHIGGDECDYMLQGDLIRHMAEWLTAHGRRAIGWDEVLRPDLPKDVVIMVWHGMDKAREAISQGHDVILSPGVWCYLDQYQDAMWVQPEAIGGYCPLEKVCEFQPLAGLTEREIPHVLGLQGNEWAEYIGTPEHHEEMLYPRIIALAEIGQKGAIDDVKAFRRRAVKEVRKLRKAGINAFNLDREVGQRPESLRPTHHMAEGCAVSYGYPFSPYYPADGDISLTDGLRGGWHHGDGRWQGFIGRGVDFNVDFYEQRHVNTVSIDFFNSPGVEIFLPSEITVNGLQPDNDPLNGVDTDGYAIVTYHFTLNADMDKFNLHATPNAAGGWLFTDEVVVE